MGFSGGFCPIPGIIRSVLTTNAYSTRRSSGRLFFILTSLSLCAFRLEQMKPCPPVLDPEMQLVDVPPHRKKDALGQCIFPSAIEIAPEVHVLFYICKRTFRLDAPIDPKDREKIFDRFWRADPAHNRDTGGHGLGLAIARSIVEAHKGKISVESSEKEGTAFTVLLNA